MDQHNIKVLGNQGVYLVQGNNIVPVMRNMAVSPQQINRIIFDKLKPGSFSALTNHAKVIRFILSDAEYKFVFPRNPDPLNAKTNAEYNKLKTIILELVKKQLVHLNIKILGQEGIYLKQDKNLLPFMQNIAVDTRDIDQIDFGQQQEHYFINFKLNDAHRSVWQYIFHNNAFQEYERLVGIISTISSSS